MDEQQRCSTCGKTGPNYSKGEVGVCSNPWHFRDDITPPPSHPQGDEWLDKIFDQLTVGGNVGNIVNPKPGVLGTAEAKGAILTELHKREVAARLDELNSFDLTGIQVRSGMTTQHTINVVVAIITQRMRERIAQLQQPKQEHQDGSNN